MDEDRRWRPHGLDFEEGPIQVRIGSVEQLFNPIDPSPLPERSLHPEVADWIEEWAEDIGRHHPLDVEVHVANGRLDGREALIAHAIQAHFEYRTWQLSRSLHKLLGEGRISLAIGLVALFGFTMASRLIGPSDSAVVEVVREGLAVLGWVSMWQPLQILLYEWWPIRRERSACRRIAEATVTFPIGPSR